MYRYPDKVSSDNFPEINPLSAGDFYNFYFRSPIDKYLSEYVLHEFVKKDIRFRIPVLDVFVRRPLLVGEIEFLRDFYIKCMLDANVHYNESEFVKELSAILPEIPENILVAQCFLMDTPMYLLYDNRENGRFDLELYTCKPYLLKKFYAVEDYYCWYERNTNPCDVVVNENRRGRLSGFRLVTNEGLNRYGEIVHISSKSTDDFEWEIQDKGTEKLSTGYRPGEKNRLGYFVPEPVLSTLKYKYLLRSPMFGHEQPSAEFDYREMLNWVADIIFVDFVNKKTYGKKYRTRVYLNSIEDTYGKIVDGTWNDTWITESNCLYDSEKSYVKFTTEGGNKITVDLFGLLEIHKVKRIS